MDTKSTDNQGVVNGMPLFLLRLEGFVYFVAGLYLFGHCQKSWWMFAALFFAPDVGMLGYLLGPRVGAVCYNIVHVEIVPIVLGIGSLMVNNSFLFAFATIWFCHIGFDRMLGFGLKYTRGFGYTHLGVMRRKKSQQG